MSQTDDKCNNFKLKISEDKLTAFINLCPPTEGNCYTTEDVSEFLKTNKVIFGILEDEIERLIKDKIYYEDVVIARGKESIEGQDGYFEFCVDMEAADKPRILEDGSVDYRIVNRIVTVTEGTVLVKYHPATNGVNGATVLGTFLVGKNGKNLLPIKGKGFVLSDDKTIYTASTTGKVEFKNDRLIVSEVFEFKGDVDYNVGAIDFKGDVVIQGNVMLGTMIKASGNIIVNGHVEGAILIAGKDIVLKNGMQGGGKGTVEAGGNVSGKFFEQVIIKAGGSVNANAIMNCKINSNEEVIVSGKHGIIVGGSVYALKQIKAAIIGNLSEIRTDISVGSDKDLLLYITQLEEKIYNLSIEIGKIESGIIKIEEILSKMNNNDLRMKKMKLIRAKVERNTEFNKLNDEKMESLRKLQLSSQSVVIIEKMVYGGTLVTVNGNSLLVKEEHPNVTFKLRGNMIAMFGNDS